MVCSRHFCVRPVTSLLLGRTCGCWVPPLGLPVFSVCASTCAGAAPAPCPGSHSPGEGWLSLWDGQWGSRGRRRTGESSRWRSPGPERSAAPPLGRAECGPVSGRPGHWCQAVAWEPWRVLGGAVHGQPRGHPGKRGGRTGQVDIAKWRQQGSISTGLWGEPGGVLGPRRPLHLPRLKLLLIADLPQAKLSAQHEPRCAGLASPALVLTPFGTLTGGQGAHHGPCALFQDQHGHPCGHGRAGDLHGAQHAGQGPFPLGDQHPRVQAAELTPSPGHDSASTRPGRGPLMCVIYPCPRVQLGVHSYAVGGTVRGRPRHAVCVDAPGLTPCPCTQAHV